MDDDVEAVLERPLHDRRGEGVVGDGEDSARARKFSDSAEVGDAEQRIARRLNPDQPRLRRQRRLDRGAVAGVDVGDLQSRRSRAHTMEQPPTAAVEVVRGDDMGAVIEQFEHRRLRRQAGSEGEARRAALHLGERVLERRAGRIAGARIFPARVHAGRRLDEGRSCVDRRDDGAGRRIGFLAAVNSARRGASALGCRRSGHRRSFRRLR